MSDPRDLLGAYVRAVHGWNRQSVQGEGKVVAYSEGPQYLIETSAGGQFWWREHLVEVVPEEARKSTPLVSDETPDQVTLDDLPAIDFTEGHDDWTVCYRCGGLVIDGDSVVSVAGREAHARWHAAIEDLTVTVQLESTGPWPKDIRVRPSLKEQLIASGFAYSVKDVEQADAAASAQPVEFQPLRDQLIERLTTGPAFRDETACVDYLLPLVEAWGEKYLSRATAAEAETERLRLDLRRTNDLVAVLRGQVAELDRRRQDCAEKHTPLFEPPFGLREQLLDALQVKDTGQDIVQLVRELHAEFGKLELAAKAEPVSPSVAGIIDAQNVELLRLAARGRRAYAETAPDEQAKHLSHEYRIFEAAARLIEDPRRLAGLIPTSMQTWSLDDDVSEIVAKATGIRVVLLDTQPEPSPPCQSKFLYQPDGEPERLLWCGKTVPHDEDHYHFLSPGHGVRWTLADQAGLVHLGDSDVDVPERPAFLDEQPAGVCPSLYLHNGALLDCAGVDDHHGTHTNSSDTVTWTDAGAVPVPWPLDQEPPAGIDYLRDTGDNGYLCRMTDGWAWWSQSTLPTGDTSETECDTHEWATAVLDVNGDLHVVRPQ